MSCPVKGKHGFERGAPRPRSMSLAVFDTGLLILYASCGDMRILEAYLARQCLYREPSGEFRRGGRPRRRSPARAVDNMLLQVPQGWLTSILMAWEAWAMEDELEVMFADGVRRKRCLRAKRIVRALHVRMGEESECERAIAIWPCDIREAHGSSPSSSSFRCGAPRPHVTTRA